MIEETKYGGKGTDINGWLSCVPPRALREIGRNMKKGAKKYGVNNWHGNIVVSDGECAGELDHADMHSLDYRIAGDVEELVHAASRLMMAIEHLMGGTNYVQNVKDGGKKIGTPVEVYIDAVDEVLDKMNHGDLLTEPPGLGEVSIGPEEGVYVQNNGGVEPLKKET